MGWVQVTPNVTLNYITLHLIIFLLDWYFKNLTIELHVKYVFNMHTKLCANHMQFTIQSKNPSFMHNFKHQNLKFKHLIDDIVINLKLSWNFASM